MDTVDPPAAFGVLADETRTRILYALAEHQREHPEDRALGFADLRRRTGADDSGNFSYHLDRLEGTFVDQAEEGYQLTYLGQQIVGKLVAGTYDDSIPMEPVELDDPCPICGGGFTARYWVGGLNVVCPEEHGFLLDIPPKVVRTRPIREVLALLARRLRYQTDLMTDGICPSCYGEVTMELEESPTENVVYRLDPVCQECGMLHGLGPAHAAWSHPEVVAFLHEQGLDLVEQLLFALEMVRADRTTVLSEDPLHLRVDLEVGGEPLSVTVDDEGNLIDVEHG